MPLTLYSPSPLSPALRTLDKSPCRTGCHSRCTVLHLRHPHYALWTRVRAGQDATHAVQSFTFVTRTTHPEQESVQDRMPLTLYSPSPSSHALRTLDKSPCRTGCHSRCTVLHLRHPHYALWTRVRA